MLTKQLNKSLYSQSQAQMTCEKSKTYFPIHAEASHLFLGVLTTLTSSVQLPHSVTVDTKQLKTSAFSASTLIGTDQLCILHPKFYSPEPEAEQFLSTSKMEKEILQAFRPD